MLKIKIIFDYLIPINILFLLTHPHHPPPPPPHHHHHPPPHHHHHYRHGEAPGLHWILIFESEVFSPEVSVAENSKSESNMIISFDDKGDEDGDVKDDRNGPGCGDGF